MLNSTYATILQTTKSVIKMAQVKAVITILNILTGSYYGYIMFVNLDNIKGAVLLFFLIVYGGVNIYFRWKKGNQAIREKEYQLWEMEREKKKKDRQESGN